MKTQSSPLSWRTPKSEVRQSPIHGRGLFAVAPIAKDEIVMIKGGHIVCREQLSEINAALGPVEIQIGHNLFIAPVTTEEREGSMLYSNHSCDANLGLRGEHRFCRHAQYRSRRGTNPRLVRHR